MPGVNEGEWEELLRGILGVNEKEWEVFITLNEYLRDEGHGLREEGKIIPMGVSIPALFKGLSRIGSEPMLYRTLEKLGRKGFITKLGKGKYTLNVGAIQEKIERYKEMVLERELIDITRRQKELEALKEEKPIDYLSNAFGGLYIESKKYPEEPLSMERFVEDINSVDTKNHSLLMQLDRHTEVMIKNIDNNKLEELRKIKGDKLDLIIIISFSDSDAKDKFILLEDRLKDLFQKHYERDKVRLVEAEKIPSELLMCCFVSKPWVKLEKEGIEIGEIKQSFVSWHVPGSLEKYIYRGVINRDSRVVEYVTKAFLRFWEMGKKFEEVIGK